MNRIILTFLLCSLSIATYADEPTIKEQQPAGDTLVFIDTTLLTGTAKVTDTVNFEKHLNQQPTKALFKSMFIPGWGQVGNKRYIKGLCFFAFDVWMISKALDHKKKARDFWNQYEESETISEKNYYYNLYSGEKDERNKFTWYAVITSFIAMFDAYVDAHLSGFPAKHDNNKFSLDIDKTEDYDTKISLNLSF
ncbi:MAG: hypothetical protein DWP97_09720 [Calditrichaeota bacterium]|nr:MAG: hypothetical protein DWP97_09720 [Calditrichota bacterium]